MRANDGRRRLVAGLLLGAAGLGLAASGLLPPTGSQAARLYGQALAALDRGDLEEAAAAARDAALRGGAEYGSLRDSLLGHVAWRRAATAAAAARGPLPAPRALEEALVQAREALRAWQAAALAREDRPAARRNAERAWRLLAELERRRHRPPRGRPPGQPPPEAPRRPVETPPLETPAAAPTPERLREVVARLEEIESDRRRRRPARVLLRRAPVEKDW